LIVARPRIANIIGEPLIDISSSATSARTLNCKRLADIVLSFIALILLIPVYIAIAIAVKLDSSGPIIYSQERIGYHKRPFKIYKFRTMTVDSEPNGPSLSSDNDNRITNIGKFLRKYRLDELPQFYNVIRGDMSLVGPRPEREYYIKQIVAKAPYYNLIHQVRPGITSWGMVKYGYATTVDQMIERLQYDLIYLDNVSLLIDLKILFHTVNTVFTGKGL
jgi:exopolysaccharide biosynthesis polyprenyl glycosylphosphotransferase